MIDCSKHCFYQLSAVDTKISSNSSSALSVDFPLHHRCAIICDLNRSPTTSIREEGYYYYYSNCLVAFSGYILSGHPYGIRTLTFKHHIHTCIQGRHRKATLTHCRPSTDTELQPVHMYSIVLFIVPNHGGGRRK
jgi:hypothetical protein